MQSRPPKIGITGGIGSGKTTITRIFQVLGIPVYNSDERAKHILAGNAVVVEKIKELIGDRAYTDDGPDRKFIASQIFSDKKKLDQVNRIIHPEVEKDFNQWADEHITSPYVIKEAALLIETGSYKKLDKTVTVFAGEEKRMERVLKRDQHRTAADVRSIMDRQMSEQQKMKASDYVIYNDDKQMVIPQVLKLHNNLLEFFD